MERIAFIVDRLNSPPFRKGFSTLSELDSKSPLELLDLVCEVIVSIDPDLESLLKDTTESRIQRIIKFLVLMKFNIPEDQMDDFQNLLMAGDVDILHTILHWCLQRFEHLQKRAYLSKYLMPVDVPPEFINEGLIVELSQRLKQLQQEFKEVHKTVDQLRLQTGNRPAELKAEIAQLEQERTQLQSKIQRMKKDTSGDDTYFQEMLKVCETINQRLSPKTFILTILVCAHAHSFHLII